MHNYSKTCKILTIKKKCSLFADDMIASKFKGIVEQTIRINEIVHQGG